MVCELYFTRDGIKNKRRCTYGPQVFDRMFNFLALREIQIKTAMRYHLTPIRMTIIDNTRNNKFWRGCV